MRIAHLSDFHLRHFLPGTSLITSRLSRHMPDLLREAVAELKSETLDLVVLTGDLVDYPAYGMHNPDLTNLGEKDLRLIKEIFSQLACPVIFIYGNHDHPENFWKVFGDTPKDFEIADYRILLFFDDETSDHFPQRLDQERKRFLTVLSDDNPKPQIHIQHYLINPELNEYYPHTYREAESLKNALKKDQRVHLVLSGHYHVGIPLFCEDNTCFSVASAFTEPPHPYRIYTLDENLITEEEHSLRPFPRRDIPRPAVFLDRDGVINPQPEYHTGPDPFCLIEGVGDALLQLQNAGFALVVVTNQTAVAAGWVTTETVGMVNDKMGSLLWQYGVSLDGVYCRHHTKDAIIEQFRSNTPGTKPSPAMLQQAAEELHLNLSTSFMVGDHITDLQAGRNAGCQSCILVKTGGGQITLPNLKPGDADFVAENLLDAAKWILATEEKTLSFTY